MLLAKLKDKLFNRRNTYEIESLEGDVNINDISLKEVTEWAKSISSKLSIDEYGNLYINGNLRVGDESDGLLLASLAYLCDYDSHLLFPLENNAGKVLAVNEDEDGLVAVEKGTKLYVHTLTSNSFNDTLIVISNSPTPIVPTNAIYYAVGENGVISITAYLESQNKSYYATSIEFTTSEQHLILRIEASGLGSVSGYEDFNGVEDEINEL